MELGRWSHNNHHTTAAETGHTAADTRSAMEEVYGESGRHHPVITWFVDFHRHGHLCHIWARPVVTSTIPLLLLVTEYDYYRHNYYYDPRD